ncbi:hypothetical protein AAFF_G00033610 [Aldrovandia affinis]|uniref:Uncharacterized protein n=1 Tax=Aldrovandia affinis TaxID=143900 RepID=A0AAD7S5X1_9TELE|nr:hypothetical protein AAFF_G00033610 [Aldrovandia affinis]
MPRWSECRLGGEGSMLWRRPSCCYNLHTRYVGLKSSSPSDSLGRKQSPGLGRHNGALDGEISHVAGLNKQRETAGEIGIHERRRKRGEDGSSTSASLLRGTFDVVSASEAKMHTRRHSKCTGLPRLITCSQLTLGTGFSSTL